MVVVAVAVIINLYLLPWWKVACNLLAFSGSSLDRSGAADIELALVNSNSNSVYFAFLNYIAKIQGEGIES